jgi:hypothetical protein
MLLASQRIPKKKVVNERQPEELNKTSGQKKR